MMDHPFEFGWFPLWYGGIPYQNTYPPLLHALVAAAAWVSGASPALSYHAVTALLYCLGPVTLFLLALKFSGRMSAALAAGAAWSLVSPSIPLVEPPAAWEQIAWNPLRLDSLVVYGDSPHIAALTLLPLALLALHRALRRRTPGAIYLAAAALAAAALTNWLGAFALAIAALSYLLARSHEPGWGRTVAWACLAGGIAYALAAPWMPPSTIGDIRHNAQHVGGKYPLTLAHLGCAALAAAAAVALRELCGRLRASLFASFSAFLLLFFGALVLTADWLGVSLMPQAFRYRHEFEMALCLLGAFACVRLADRLPRPGKIILACAAAAAALLQFGGLRSRARELIRPIDMTQTVEYQAAAWLRDNLPDARVFISGSTQFWLNAFTDNPQIGGGFDQGIVNRQIPNVRFSIPWTENDGENTAMWLRLYGAQAVVVSGPDGRDFYKRDWRSPAKFAGILPEIRRDRGDVIYAVPQRSPSLAHAILPEHAVRRSPVNHADLDPVRPLAEALEDASLPLAALAWQGTDRARIAADLRPEHLLFVQISHHPGWRASVRGEPLPIRKDGLGFMVIEPRCQGPCEVTLTYDGGLEMRIAKLLSGLTALGGLVWGCGIGALRRLLPRRLLLLYDQYACALRLQYRKYSLRRYGERLLSRRALAGACGLFALNALLCRELFSTEYSKHLGSIEASFIAISRYMMDHPFEFGWFPLWYGGVPYQNTYPPLLHALVAAAAWVSGASPALMHHAVTALLYCLGPVTLFLLALKFSGRIYAALATGAAYSLVSPSISFIEPPAAWEQITGNPLRLDSLVVYGDGPHISSLTLLPLALLALHRALRRRTPGAIYLAAAALAAVALTNWLGAFTLAIAALSYLLARSHEPGWGRTVAWACLAGGIAYALAAPWMPPSTIGNLSYSAQHIAGKYPMTLAHLGYASLAAAAAVVLRELCRRLRASLFVGFSAFLLLFSATLVLFADWLSFSLMPQALRYRHEFEMALCLLGAFACIRLAGRLPRPGKIILACAATAAALLQFGGLRGRARELIQPIDMTQTIEYQAASWLRDNLPDARVFISGSTQFWLNAFSDNPQIGGGIDQSMVNRQIPNVKYGIPWTEDDGENTAMWLRLYGAQAVVVSGPEGRDFYKHDWRSPAKFEGVLPELRRDRGDVIYAVPQRSPSLAHVILPEHVVEQPIDYLDLEPVRPLAEALEDASLPLASFAWQDPDRARIAADLRPEHLLFVQISHHPGWRASVRGEPLAIRKDGLGFMILEPRCQGPCEVTLTYDGGLEMRIAKLLSGLTVLGGLVWGFRVRRRRNTAQAD